jgi:SAM domain (Sterile alpha motif)
MIIARQQANQDAIMDTGGWLRSLGLERYEAAFRENEITEKVLASLTAEDLKDLGVAIVGHRRMLLDAIATLRAYASAKAPPPQRHPRHRTDAYQRVWSWRAATGDLELAALR